MENFNEKKMRKDLKKNKKADIPFWLTMVIWALVGAVVILIIIGLERGKLLEFLDWLG